MIENSRYKLVLGDALTLLKGIESESVDLIFADPPYLLSNNGITCSNGKMVSVDKGEWDKSKGFESDCQFHEKWIEQCRRILKPNGTMWVSGTYHSIYLCGYALQKNDFHIINDISWLKPNAPPNLSCRTFTASHETLLWAKKSKKSKHTFNYEIIKNGDWHENDALKKEGKQMRSVWSLTPPKPIEKRYGKHPTQKPESLLERIILASSNPYDIVLDPFCGSGTTGVVSVRYKRKFLGFDISTDFLKTSAKRIEDEIIE